MVYGGPSRLFIKPLAPVFLNQVSGHVCRWYVTEEWTEIPRIAGTNLAFDE